MWRCQHQVQIRSHTTVHYQLPIKDTSIANLISKKEPEGTQTKYKNYAQYAHFYNGKACTPRPHTALLMCQEKYSAIGISAIGNYWALYSKT